MDPLELIMSSRDVITMNTERIREKVFLLKKKYRSDDPYTVIQSLGILLTFENLGTLNGYYTKKYRIKHIHINEYLSELQQKFACAHELGHAILHPNSNTPFLTRSTYLSVNKLESEANKFAVEFLIPDDLIYEYAYSCGYTTDQIGRILGYQKELIELRLK